MNDKKEGSIIIESLIGLSLLVGTLCSLSYLSFKIWAQSFTKLESFYLSRARLYGNTQRCRVSSLVPQTLIRRNYLCKEEAYP